MSHDISALRVSTGIANLKRGGLGNPSRHIIYRALDCQEYDSFVSGTGESKLFTISEIKRGLERLEQATIECYADNLMMNDENRVLEDVILECEPERIFLQKIIDSGEREILIRFA